MGSTAAANIGTCVRYLKMINRAIAIRQQLTNTTNAIKGTIASSNVDFCSHIPRSVAALSRIGGTSSDSTCMCVVNFVSAYCLRPYLRFSFIQENSVSPVNAIYIPYCGVTILSTRSSPLLLSMAPIFAGSCVATTAFRDIAASRASGEISSARVVASARGVAHA